LDRIVRAGAFAYQIRKVKNRDGLVRTDVVGPSVFALEQDGPEPFSKIGGVKIRTQRRSVATDHDRTVRQAIANKIADREVRVQRQVRPDKGKTAWK